MESVIPVAWDILQSGMLGVGINELHRRLVNTLQRQDSGSVDLQKALYRSLLSSIKVLGEALSSEEQPYFNAITDFRKRNEELQRVKHIFLQIRQEFPKVSALSAPVQLLLGANADYEVKALLTRLGIESYLDSLPEALRNSFYANLSQVMLINFRQEVANDQRLSALLQLDLTVAGFQQIQRELDSVSRLTSGEFQEVKDQNILIIKKIDELMQQNQPSTNLLAASTQQPPTTPPSRPELRRQLNQIFDAVELDSFCLDYFSKVYDKFSPGMRKDRKITLLLDHCRRIPTRYQRLIDLLGRHTE